MLSYLKQVPLNSILTSPYLKIESGLKLSPFVDGGLILSSDILLDHYETILPEDVM